MLQKFIANDLNTAKNKMRKFTLRDDTEQRKRRLTQEKVLLSFYNKNLMPIDVPKEDLMKTRKSALKGTYTPRLVCHRF